MNAHFLLSILFTQYRYGSILLSEYKKTDAVSVAALKTTSTTLLKYRHHNLAAIGLGALGGSESPK